MKNLAILSTLIPTLVFSCIDPSEQELNSYLYIDEDDYCYLFYDGSLYLIEVLDRVWPPRYGD